MSIPKINSSLDSNILLTPKQSEPGVSSIDLEENKAPQENINTTLPPELLWEIFKYAALSDQTGKTLATIPRVCKHWEFTMKPLSWKCRADVALKTIWKQVKKQDPFLYGSVPDLSKDIRSCLKKESFSWIQPRIDRLTLTDLDHRVTVLPPEIGELSELNHLVISGAEFLIDSTIPESFCNLPKLEFLQLTGIRLSTLPESFGFLFNLQKLVLSGNYLNELPSSFSNLSHLKKLLLDYNHFTVFPEQVTELTGLIELSLSNNNLSTLPTSIGKLTNLQKLNLYKNVLGEDLSELPGETEPYLKMIENCFIRHKVPTESVRNLQDQLKRQEFEEDYEVRLYELGDMRNELCKNQEEALPQSMGNLINLEELDLSYNPKLVGLPESMRELKIHLKLTRCVSMGNGEIPWIPEKKEELAPPRIEELSSPQESERSNSSEEKAASNRKRKHGNDYCIIS